MNKNQMAVELGRLGGLATSKKYGKAHHVKMALLSAKARKPKMKVVKDIVRVKLNEAGAKLDGAENVLQ